VSKSAGRKTVIASLGAVAASGGYYIASAAHKVVANPGTITGSIGALLQFFRIEDLLEKVGIRMEVLKTGEFKDIGSPHRELTARDREILEGVLADIRSQFVRAVAGGRNLPAESVEKVADGRIFSGARAKELGLVDELGNFHDAVELAKKEAGIQGDASLVYPRKRLGFLESFFKAAFRSLASELLEMQTRLEYRWEAGAVPRVTEK
jgi:protease IV